ncbi:metal-activated pyridoxal enzyme [Legionella norrlandica]|uniref:Metal-activated pyridoxal enzyme n=1 Tax=Legionella norrlandica TaxID=1498499 RepID=A0A0A2SU26_9GAMM|nr:DSD1 family PLP-dependent enzyme [Legionella norrlandica]KGP64262.1 metal-activated pyridoxal enzyme [Legionella norrlandica]
MKEKHIGLNKFELDTPCLVIDYDALKYNLDLMQQHAAQYGIGIRPHCKTHKSTQIARLQLEYGAIGISAAKLSEAEVLISKQITNILITSPIVSNAKYSRLLNCLKSAPDLMLVVDNKDNIQKINSLGELLNQPVNVLLDIDSGIGRTGVSPALALEYGHFINRMNWLNLKGIQCYAGNLQHIQTYEERRVSSLRVMEMASEIVKGFKAADLPCDILTGTGTGTFDIDVEASEVTEIQPGSYTVMDVEYAAIGSKVDPLKFSMFKNSMTLLTSVISSNRKEHVTVDAGTKSIYFDLHHKPLIISHPGLMYDWGGFGDEHGKVFSPEGSKLPQNGEVLELIVPHCDPTINLFDKFYITKNNTVIDIWDIDLRGKSQ